MTYKVGDKVEYVAAGRHYAKAPKVVGEVVLVNLDGAVAACYGVRFPGWGHGHSLDDSMGPITDGYWCWDEDLKLASTVTSGESSNPVFHFRAGEDLGDDAWGMMVNGVAGCHSWPDVVNVTREWEREYKDKAPGNPLPGAYRSAKSVIKGAINNSIPLMIAGAVRGKTAVQKDIKAAKESVKKTALEMIAGKLEGAWKIAKETNNEEYFHNYIKAYFTTEN